MNRATQTRNYRDLVTNADVVAALAARGIAAETHCSGGNCHHVLIPLSDEEHPESGWHVLFPMEGSWTDCGLVAYTGQEEDSDDYVEFPFPDVVIVDDDDEAKIWIDLDGMADFARDLIVMIGVETAWTEILNDLADPASALSRCEDPAYFASFGTLHDFVDANEYAAEIMDNTLAVVDGEIDFSVGNEIQSAIDARLAAGRHVAELALR